MFRSNNMNIGNGGALQNTGTMSKIKGIFSRFNMTTLIYPVSYTHLTLPTNREV